MALKCPNCGAWNADDLPQCGFCGWRLLSSSSTLGSEARSTLLSRRTRRLIVLAVVIVVAVLAISATLAYYYEPVRGDGSIWPSSVVLGGSIAFRFTPAQGVGPFTYAWSFGDGTTSSQNAGDHIYKSLGTYEISVIVTDRAGQKCIWTTDVVVRQPLVFIDKVAVPFYDVNYFGSDWTTYTLYLDGHQTSMGVGLTPGTNHTVELKIYWNVNFAGGPPQWDLHDDLRGTVSVPTTNNDLHYELATLITGGFTLSAL